MLFFFFVTGMRNFSNCFVELSVIQQQTLSRLPEVIVSVLRNLYDPRFEVPHGSILPTPTAFVSDRNATEQSIEFLKVKKKKRIIINYNKKAGRREILFLSFVWHSSLICFLCAGKCASFSLFNLFVISFSVNSWR